MSEIQKQDLTSMNIAEEQLRKLKELFPEAFTEGLSVDWDKLRLTLGQSIDVGKERYGMNWPGKADCFKTIQQPSIATLIPAREESVEFDKTENLFIEGDNLEVLKLLQKSFLGKIKFMYFDPPYNTGKDFIYPDNYSESLDTYLEYTGQVDADGKKFGTNTDTDGRYHSKWMNMMYPRLFLSKNLLTEDGIIFISIDDKEVNNLKSLCNEIFGEENFIGQLVKVSNSAKNNVNHISITHDYAIVYAKNKNLTSKEWSVPKNNVEEFTKRVNWLYKRNVSKEEIEKELKELVKYPRFYDFDHYYFCDEVGVYRTDNPGGVPKGNLESEIIHPITKRNCKKPNGGWRYNDNTIKEMLAKNMWHFGDDENTIPAPKRYLKDYLSQKPLGVHFFDSQMDAKKLKADNIPFDFPKPIEYIKFILKMEGTNEGIVLDIFAGSGTTAEAVFSLNKDDGGKRKFICVQIPEPTEENSEAQKAGFNNIAEISKERIRRVGKKIKTEIEADAKKKVSQLNFETTAENDSILDLGFKVFKLSKSNFKIWDSTLEKEPEAIQAKLFEHIQHISPESEQEAILYELLLKSGFELTTPIEKLTLAGLTVFSIAEGQLLVCLEKELTHDCLKAMAEMQPTRVICLDEGFKGENADALKTNAVQIMKSKGVVNFRTV
jgi:adenine-specific DNA-methyltransferase